MKSVIIPVKNEVETITRTLDTLSELDDSEVIIIDDSADSSFERIMNYQLSNRIPDLLFCRQEQPSRGKGGAIKEGLEIATGDPIIFLDADIETLEASWVEELSKPIENGGADIVKADYDYEGDDHVTQLVAKPWLENVFPEVTCNRPLEGEMAVSKEVLSEISLADGFCVESSFIIDAYLKGYRIKEVYLGKKVHAGRKGRRLKHLAMEVLDAILTKAIEYNRI